MKKYLITLFALASLSAAAQDFSAVLGQIESNNTTLKVLREEAEAARLQAKTGLTLADPSVDLAYLWDLKNEGGYRVNVGATQTFDFPSVYYWRNRISEGECTAADIEYAIGRKGILLEAEQVCINLVYHNALHKELQRCLENAEAIAKSLELKYENGGASLVELNEARFGLLSASKAVKENLIERDAMLAELTRLNGGKAMDFNMDVFAAALLPADFEVWYADAVTRSSELQAVENAKAVAASSVKLAQAEWLPKFSLGYASEMNSEVSLHGVGFGFSIPLWKNKGKVKAAKAREAAAVAQAEDSILQFYSSLKAMYTKALNMADVSAEFRSELASLSTVDLLYEALSGGQISVEEYVYGVELWQDALIEVLSCERDCHLLISELNNFSR